MTDPMPLSEKKYGILSIWLGVFSIFMYFAAFVLGALIATPGSSSAMDTFVYTMIVSWIFGVVIGAAAIYFGIRQRRTLPTGVATAGIVTGSIGAGKCLLFLMWFGIVALMV